MFQFVVILFILIAGYKVLGINALIAGACVSAAYLYWFSTPSKTPVVIDKFIDSDRQLTRAMRDLENDTKAVPYDYEAIVKMMDTFIEIYLDCFCNEKSVKHAFSDLTRTRRDILNYIDRLGVSPKRIEVATWKYVHIIIQKYDLDYEYPVPHNEFMSGQDVY